MGSIKDFALELARPRIRVLLMGLLDFSGGQRRLEFPTERAGGSQICHRASLCGRSKAQVRSCTPTARLRTITEMAASQVGMHGPVHGMQS